MACEDGKAGLDPLNRISPARYTDAVLFYAQLVMWKPPFWKVRLQRTAEKQCKIQQEVGLEKALTKDIYTTWIFLGLDQS